MQNVTAQILKDSIQIRHSRREDVNREFLTFDVSGWEDVEKISKKILSFEGRKFAFTGWNSDRNECYFARPLNEEVKFAKIVWLSCELAQI